MQLTATEYPSKIISSNARSYDLRAALNNNHDAHPQHIIETALVHAERPVISTNFRPGSAALLHMVVTVAPDIPVIWVDTGLNSASTYRHIEKLTAAWRLNLQVFSAADLLPEDLKTAGGVSGLASVPAADEPEFERFVEKVKLEPFKRAFATLKPDVWFTGIRREQTAYRRELAIASTGPNQSLRVAPLLDWHTAQVEAYCREHQIIETHDYVDPTKPQAHLECGLQLIAS